MMRKDFPEKMNSCNDLNLVTGTVKKNPWGRASRKKTSVGSEAGACLV